MYTIIVYEKEETGKRTNVAWKLIDKTDFEQEGIARSRFAEAVKLSVYSAAPVKIVLNHNTHKLASFTLNKPF